MPCHGAAPTCHSTQSSYQLVLVSGPKSGSWSLVSSPQAGPPAGPSPGPQRVQVPGHTRVRQGSWFVVPGLPGVLDPGQQRVLVCSPWSAKGPSPRSASWSPALHTTNPLTYPKTGLGLAISGGLNQMSTAAALPCLAVSQIESGPK